MVQLYLKKIMRLCEILDEKYRKEHKVTQAIKYYYDKVFMET